MEEVKMQENSEEVVENITENTILNQDEQIEKLNAELDETKAKADEYFEHLKRNMAEFDNYKKRVLKEKESLYSTITSDIVSDLLPIMDNFDTALQAEATDASFKEGMQMIYNQLVETLKKLGVEEIICLNKTFDPNLEEAVMHIEDENFGEKEIVEVFRKGYKIGDKVVRHAMVKVAN